VLVGVLASVFQRLDLLLVICLDWSCASSSTGHCAAFFHLVERSLALADDDALARTELEPRLQSLQQRSHRVVVDNHLGADNQRVRLRL
jgi:hypothetical protein